MFGILIGDIRRHSGIQTEELIQGICTEGMLRKYETGVMEPEKLLADALFQRLGKSIDKYDIMLDADEYALAVARAKIPVLLTQNRLAEAEQAIQAYTGLEGADKPLHLQFAALERAELLRRQNASLEAQERNILYGLGQTIEEACGSVLRPYILQERRFCLTELYLLQRYAVIKEQQGKELEAYDWHQGILEYLKPKKRRGKFIEYDKNDMRKIYPFSAYWLAGIYAGRQQYTEALELIENSCEMLGISKTQSALFAHTIELKFRIIEMLGEQPEEWEKNCYALMCEAIGPNRELWWEDWYPVHMELHIHSINEVIGERRRAHGMTEEDLALEICDARTIKRLETGQRMPQKKNRDALLERLGLSTEKYDGGIVTGKYSDYKRQAVIVQCYNRRDTPGTESVFRDLRKDVSEKHITNHQFVEFWRALIQKMKNEITEEMYTREMWKLFTETVPEYDNTLQAECELMKYERELIKMLGWWRGKEQRKELQTIITGQYKLMNERIYKKCFFRGFYNEMVYCCGINLFSQGKYDEAADLLDDELEKLCLLHRDTQWGQLLFARARVEAEKEKAETGKENKSTAFSCLLRYAYAISKLYLRDKVAQKFFVEYVKNHYPQQNDFFGDL